MITVLHSNPLGRQVGRIGINDGRPDEACVSKSNFMIFPSKSLLITVQQNHRWPISLRRGHGTPCPSNLLLANPIQRCTVVSNDFLRLAFGYAGEIAGDHFFRAWPGGVGVGEV